MAGELEAPYGGEAAAWAEWAENLVASAALGLRCRSIGAGAVEMVLDEAIYGLNPNGAVHGGLVANAADQVMGVAVTTALPDGQVPVTSTFSMEYHRPAVLPLVFRAHVSRAGKAVVFVDVDVEAGTGTVCGRGHASMVPRSANPTLRSVGT